MKANRITYCELYKDTSTVEFGVEYSDEAYLHDKSIKGIVTLTHIDSITFPITKINWLIECLERVRANAEVRS